MMRIFATGFSDEFDGPGRRWVVYLKGCNLRCRWCANPESLSSAKQVLYYPGRSLPDKKVCPHGALADDGCLDRSICRTCDDFACVTTWKHKAFELAGRDVSPQWILEEALKVAPLFGQDGGVTFGGGEPTLQADELLDTIRLLKNSGIHTAMESNAGTADFIRLAGEVDFLIADIKAFSSGLHEGWAGCGNEVILDNIHRAADMRQQLLIRIPMIVGLNDSPAEMKLIADFLAGLNCDDLRVEVLRMHHMGRCKYEALGMDYTIEDVPEPTLEAGGKFIDELQAAGLNAQLA